jgi:hypothetical protein
MTDPFYLRLSDADDPDRAKKFTKALKPNAANGNAVLRQLVDSFNTFVAEHGRTPVFPVQLVETRPPAKKKPGK